MILSLQGFIPREVNGREKEGAYMNACVDIYHQKVKRCPSSPEKKKMLNRFTYLYVLYLNFIYVYVQCLIFYMLEYKVIVGEGRRVEGKKKKSKKIRWVRYSLILDCKIYAPETEINNLLL